MVKNVIKRDGRVKKFSPTFISSAIMKSGVPEETALKIAKQIQSINKDTLEVEEIQDLVEKKLMETPYKSEAQEYIRFRHKREIKRQSDQLNKSILEIVDNSNQSISEENSNKNALILSTQRDYMAGEVSKDLTRKFFLEPEVVQAHDKGMIHVHDMDYFVQRMFNCCLVNMEDILQNGTVINKVLIEKPHSFATACNIATQVIANIASNQLGGQSVSLAHLAPFVDISRQKLKQEVTKELLELENLLGPNQFKAKVNEITESRVKSEVKRGVQTIQYQINTLMTTNGERLPL